MIQWYEKMKNTGEYHLIWGKEEKFSPPSHRSKYLPKMKRIICLSFSITLRAFLTLDNNYIFLILYTNNFFFSFDFYILHKYLL